MYLKIKFMDSYNNSYVNQAFAIDDEKKQDLRKGKFFWHIDFEFTNYLTEKNTAYGENPVVGNLIVGSHKMDITLSEVNKLIKNYIKTGNPLVLAELKQFIDHVPNLLTKFEES